MATAHRSTLAEVGAAFPTAPPRCWLCQQVSYATRSRSVGSTRASCPGSPVMCGMRLVLARTSERCCQTMAPRLTVFPCSLLPALALAPSRRAGGLLLPCGCCRPVLTVPLQTCHVAAVTLGCGSKVARCGSIKWWAALQPCRRRHFVGHAVCSRALLAASLQLRRGCRNQAKLHALTGPLRTLAHCCRTCPHRHCTPRAHLVQRQPSWLPSRAANLLCMCNAAWCLLLRACAVKLCEVSRARPW